MLEEQSTSPTITIWNLKALAGILKLSHLFQINIFNFVIGFDPFCPIRFQTHTYTHARMHSKI
jgi:hypothetical protein